MGLINCCLVMVAFFDPHRHHTPVGYFALLVLELNRRMVNAELGVKTFLHVPQNAFAD